MKKFRLFGQYLDKPWILKSSVCPCSLEIGDFGLGLDSDWIDSVIGQKVDRDWTKCGRGLDLGSMSNQPSLTCTDVSPSCLVAQPILLYSHVPKQNRQSGRQRKWQDQNELKQGLRADGTPCIRVPLFIRRGISPSLILFRSHSSATTGTRT